MPTGNKGGQGRGQGQGQGRQNGGVPQGDGGQGWGVGDQLREGAEKVTNRLHEGLDTAREGVGQGYRRAEGAVARNPGSSILVGFGLGFGLGVILCQLFAQEDESWTERNITKPMRNVRMPESVKNIPDHVHHLADAIISRLPNSVRSYLG